MSEIIMDRIIIRIVLLASSLWGVYSLEITNLTVPDFVRNGTEESVLLDCDYEYEEDIDKKLVVKWFHNNDPNAVYQWIPELGTFLVTDKFGDRVSTNYAVPTEDNLKRYRALHMLRPTTEMTGKYSCQVTSLASTVTKEDYMTIYATPTSVSINVSSVDEIVNVMCIIEGVFPLPQVEMFHIEPGQMDSSPVTEVYQNFVKDDDAFNVFLTTNISEHELETGGLHFFGCTVTLPGTEYKKETRIPYYPTAQNDPREYKLDNDDDDGNDDGAFDMRPSVATVLIFVSAVLVLYW